MSEFLTFLFILLQQLGMEQFTPVAADLNLRVGMLYLDMILHCTMLKYIPFLHPGEFENWCML